MMPDCCYVITSLPWALPPKFIKIEIDLKTNLTKSSCPRRLIGLKGNGLPAIGTLLHSPSPHLAVFLSLSPLSLFYQSLSLK